MSVLAGLLRFLVWVVVVVWVVSLIRRLFRELSAGQKRSNRDIDVPSDAITQKLVRDPVCGMHLAPGLALVAKKGGETFYFYSDECRKKYFSDTKFAANG